MVKMKTHKIKGIDKSVCCAEQKMAYNYAFMYRSTMERYLEKCESAIQRNDVINQVIEMIIRGFNYHEYGKKYNLDALIHAFRSGVTEYMNGFDVLWTYEDIGRIFKIHYKQV